MKYGAMLSVLHEVAAFEMEFRSKSNYRGHWTVRAHGQRRVITARKSISTLLTSIKKYPYLGRQRVIW